MSCWAEGAEGASGGLPVSHHAPFRQLLSSGQGRAVPWLTRCPCAGDNDSRALQCRWEGRVALAECPVPQKARQTFAFKVRTGLDQRRETPSVPKQPLGGRDRTISGTVTTPVPGARRVVTARGLLGLTTDRITWLSPLRSPEGSERPCNLRVRSANTSFGSSGRRMTGQGGGKNCCAVSRCFFLAEGSLGKDRETMGD